MKRRTFIFLAEGFEIIEAMAPMDMLKRAQLEAECIAIGNDRKVTSAQGIAVYADSTIGEFGLENIKKDDIMVFPGGMPGSSNLAACEPLIKKMQEHYAAGGTVASICAAPGLVLSQLPLDRTVKERGKLMMTCYEGFEKELVAKGATIVDQREGTVTDGNIITASGPGHAIAFGIKILEHISGKETAEAVAKSLML